ncbi:MAG: hypothetical protein ACFFFC_07545 [Candidatus Thorarchaeota archaeon]
MSAWKVTTAGIILVAVLGLGVVGGMLLIADSNPLQIPPPPGPPGEEPEIIIEGELEGWAEAIYWQDFMPDIPDEGPPFYTIIWINVTNIGNITVEYFYAVRMTIYFYDNCSPLATLDLDSNIQYFVWPMIRPGGSAVFEFTNVRNSIFSPTIDEGTLLYSRVLTKWENGNEMILTTPPSPLGYTQ